MENQNEYKIVKNLPTFGQCANVVCIHTLSWCKWASSQPLDNFFSTISLSNFLIPKLLHHSGDIMVLKCMSTHWLFYLKCIKTHLGWYICPQIEMIVSLWRNPYVISKKLGIDSDLALRLHMGWGWKIKLIPFFMRAKCYSFKEKYCRSQKTFLCSRSFSSISYKSSYALSF